MEAILPEARPFHWLAGPSWLRPAAAGLCLCMLCLNPAFTSLWWHLFHGNRMVWQNTSFQLPISWSIPEPLPWSGGVVYYSGTTSLVRRLSLPFPPSNNANSLFLAPAAPAWMRATTMERARQVFAMPSWGPVTESSKTISLRTFRCLSQPAPMQVFSYSRIPNVHAWCEEQSLGWQLYYSGDPKYLDEALGFLGRGQPLPASAPGKPRP
jgi:hypothetical protein